MNRHNPPPEGSQEDRRVYADPRRNLMDPFLTPPEVLVKSYLNSYQPGRFLAVRRGTPLEIS